MAFGVWRLAFGVWRLAVGSLARRAETHHAEQLFALNQRFSMLVGGKKIPEDGNPMGPYQFAGALAAMLEPLKLSNNHITIFYRLYEPILNKALTELYKLANEYLKEQGILPNLRYSINKNNASAPLSTATETDESEAANPEQTANHASSAAVPSQPAIHSYGHNPAHAGATQTAAGQQPSLETASMGVPQGQPQYQQQMLQAIYEIQQQSGNVTSQSAVAQAMAKAKAGEGSAGNILQQNAQVVDAQGLQQQLQQLPIGDAPKDLEQPQPHGIGPTEIRETAFSLRESIAESQQVLDANHDRVIDLVGMIFEFMLSDESLPDSVKAVLSYLHTPLLKMALADPILFEQEDHAGRKLLNALAYAGKRWVSSDGSSQFKVFPKIKSAVRTVIMEESSHLDQIVEQQLQEFIEFSAKVSKKIDMLEQRAKAKAEGEEKIRLVKKRVYSEVKHRMGTKRWPAPVVVLLLHPWADYLIFVLLRFGRNSEQWRQGLKMIDDILWSVQEKHTESGCLKQQQLIKRLQEVLQKAISQVAFDPHKTHNLIKMLAEVQQKAILHEEMPEINQEELEQIEKDVHLHEYLPNDDVELTEVQSNMLQKLASVKFGSWLEFTEQRDGTGC